MLKCVGIVLLAVGSSACGASRLADANGSTAAHNGDSGVSQVATAEYETLPESKLSPLDEYMSLVGGLRSLAFLDDDARARAWEARELRTQELVAECMHRFGFEYIPHLEFLEHIEAEDWNPQERAWVAQWGYGFVSRPLGGGASSGTNWGRVGPNEALLSEMSESEQRAWWSAFYYIDNDDFGLGGDNGLGFASDYGITERFGGDEIRDCRDWAWIQQGIADKITDGSEEFAPLMDAIDELRQAIRNEDISPADQAWSECMADAGFPGFDRQWEASTTINIEFNTLNTGWESFRTPEMAELQEREINMALADFDCRVSTHFAAKQQAHVIERETQFVKDNQATLNALRDAVEQGRFAN